MRITKLIIKLITLSLLLTPQSIAIIGNTLEEDARIYISVAKKYGKSFEQISTELQVSLEDLRKFRYNSSLSAEKRESIVSGLRPCIEEYNEFVEKLIDYWPSIPSITTLEIELQLFELAHRIHLPIKYTHFSFSAHNERGEGIFGSDSRIIAKCIRNIMTYKESNPYSSTTEAQRKFTRIGQKVATKALCIYDIINLSEALKAYPSNTMQLFVSGIVSALDLEHLNIIELLQHLNNSTILSYESKYLFDVTIEYSGIRKVLINTRHQYFNANEEQVTRGAENFFSHIF